MHAHPRVTRIDFGIVWVLPAEEEKEIFNKREDIEDLWISIYKESIDT